MIRHGPNFATNVPTHFLFCDDRWVPANRVWIEMPEPDADGAESAWGWTFANGVDAVAWLKAGESDG